MEMAHLYCVPLNDTTLKIGCHLGDEKAFDHRFGTYVCREHLAMKVMVPVEPKNRLCFEQALHRLLQRQPHLHKEKEKYTNDALPFFHVYANTFRLSAAQSNTKCQQEYDMMRSRFAQEKAKLEQMNMEYEAREQSLNKTIHTKAPELAVLREWRQKKMAAQREQVWLRSARKRPNLI